ncbi:hypothetical protein PMIN05_002824 [Paraphaeosphaeria minitans]
MSSLLSSPRGRSQPSHEESRRSLRRPVELQAKSRKLVTVAVFTTCKLSSTNATALPSPGLAYSFKPRQAQVSAPTLYSEQRLRQHATVHTHSTLRSPQQALSYYNFRRLSTMPAPTAPSPVRLPRSFLTIH